MDSHDAIAGQPSIPGDSSGTAGTEKVALLLLCTDQGMLFGRPPDDLHM